LLEAYLAARLDNASFDEAHKCSIGIIIPTVYER
jgi:hypothetical protein